MLKHLAAVLVAAAVLAGARADQPTPESELTVAWKFIYSEAVKKEDVNYVRFFTTYAIPEEWETPRGDKIKLREQAEHALSFVLNSCQSFKADGLIARPRRVPGSKTLWQIDIRDYGWTEQQLDDVFAIQPYFLNPLVEQPGSILFRADWFIVNAMDTTWQDDRGLKDLAYYILLYGKGHEPRDAEQFRQFWKVDINSIRVERVETGTVVDAGDSGVSRHTRQLRRGQSIYGPYWETRDIKSHDLDPDQLKSRDYIEDIFANQVDAGEYIARNKAGLQVYLLTAGNKDKFKRIEFGDPTVVIDRQDRDDPRVRTAKSCIICHALGIIPATNAIRELYQLGGDLRAKDRDFARVIKVFYLQQLNSLVEDDNRSFERKIKECNGLDPMDNMRGYANVYEWYRQKVTPEQAAFECGLAIEDYRKAIKKTTTGRLTFLYHGRAMPREIWDSLNSGGYVQSMLHLRGASAQEYARQHKQEKASNRPLRVTVTAPSSPLTTEYGQVLRHLVYGSVATVLRVYEPNPEWFVVEAGGTQGFLQRKDTAPVKD
jgi:hypothetical protein